ncbi:MULTISPECIES: AMP-binding protein [unclassified Achromobacter]|uniref:AMP-binding protein n=1 Tax=unclassified Achromobacter TaxID=2626865 RepID=UPI001E45A02D|nr:MULTISPECIES: AMP-binding protein [unclassified Achromobacter]
MEQRFGDNPALPPRRETGEGRARIRTTRSEQRIRALSDIERLEREPYDELLPSRSMYEVFQATATLYGDRPALTMLRSAALDDAPTTYTHAQLLAEITRAANLFAHFGIAGQGVVSILARTHARVPALIWGAETAGTASCINYLLAPDVIAALLQAEQTRILVCAGPALDAEVWAKACEVIARVPGLQAILVLGGQADCDDPRVLDLDELIDRQPGDRLTFDYVADPDAIAALFHTGGTTGVPKLVPQTHRNQIHAAWSLAQLFDLTEQDVSLNGFPLFHVGGTTTIGMSVLATGGHVVMLSPAGLRDPEIVKNIWRFVERYRATFIGGVPTSIGAMSEVPVNGCDVSSVRFAFTGGAPLPSAIGQRFEERTGIALLEQYGMTESVAAIAATPLNGRHVRGSVGLRAPFSAIDIMRRDETGDWVVCPAGTVGSVVARGPQIVRGYLNPEHDRNAFTPDGGLVTGDLGRLDENGYLFLTGREKDLIIRSGHNIDPQAIEDVANSHPAVAVSAAVGMPDAYAGELPVIFVALAPGQSVDTDELQRFIADRIPEPPARPRHLFVLDAIPVTGVGKIYKPALRDMALVYKLRMEIGALGQAIELIDIAAAKDGTEAAVTLRAATHADRERCDNSLAAALANLHCKVEVAWAQA